ncbi:hypothetical protein F441_22140, partial [Phytophthora nicotianae CJ01A1]
SLFDKGRVSPALKACPIYLVLNEDLGERGAHYYAYQLLKEPKQPTAVYARVEADRYRNQVNRLTSRTQAAAHGREQKKTLHPIRVNRSYKQQRRQISRITMDKNLKDEHVLIP